MFFIRGDILSKAKIIGISGCSGSGKSTVCDLLKADGAYIIDADEVSRRVVEPGTPTLKKLADRFGEDILNVDGTLNRHLLADRAFSNEKNTKALTNITHLAILNIIVREKNANLSSYNYIILDAPLLFSSKLYRLCDLTVRVCAPKQVCISRIIKRDSITPKQAYQRLKAQTKEIKLSKKADIIIRNYSPYKLTDEIKKIF